MNLTLRAYPAYKPSGIPWLGDVPSQWGIRRLKGVCKLEYGDPLPEDMRAASGAPVYGSNGLIGHAHTTNTESGCLIIGRKGSSGKVLYSDEASFAIDTTFFVDCRHTKSNIRWLYYLLSSMDLKSFSEDVGVPGLSRTKAYQQVCLIPPPDEQTAIVQYLDDIDQRIQAFVSNQERFIALLEEERQAVVQQVVTRGLDPDAKMKPSGVEWLGDLPEHWEVIQLGRTGRFSKGSGGTKEDEVDQGIPCIRYGDLYTFHEYLIAQSRSFITPDKAEEYTPIEKGDILFTTSDVTVRNVGKSAVNLIEPPVYCGGDLIILKPAGWMDHRFAGYLLDSHYAQTQKARMQRGVTIMHIYADQLGDIPFGIPPLDEQVAIARYLDEAKADIDATIARAHRQVELLEEYRTRLIADVVTGKIDARNSQCREAIDRRVQIVITS